MQAGYLITKTVVNEAGLPEIWLHDGSRRCSPEEIAFLQRAVGDAQQDLQRQRLIDAAASLTEVARFEFDEAEQRHVAYGMDLRGELTVRLTADELEALRQQILARRAAAEVAPSIFTVGGTAS